MRDTIYLATIFFLISIQAANAQYNSSGKTGNSEFIWPQNKKMAISLTFDDARYSQIEKGIPLLNRYDVKATFYVSPERLTRYRNEWIQAAAGGHEIGNHSLNHPCTANFPWSRNKAIEDYTMKTMFHELDSANHFIQSMLGVVPSSYAYPCGQTWIGRGKETKSLVPLIASMFETGRTWLDEAPNDPEQCDFAQLTGMEMDGKSFTEIKQLIDDARKNGSWLLLAGHEMNDEGRQTTLLTMLDSLCSYASKPSGEIWIASVQEVARYIKDKRGFPAGSEKMLPFQNPALSVNERIEDLLARMTLSEKIGQLNMPCGYFSELGKTPGEKMENGIRFANGTFMEGIGPGGGFFTFHNNALHEGPAQQASYMNRLQKTALESTRLKIPLLITEEGTHGLMCAGGTVFPEGPALGSTWNTELIGEVYAAAAREARAVGVHQLFTLVVEPIRDPRMGRNQEGYSEDPYMCARYAQAITEAVQGNDISEKDKVVAGLCHYPGQSEPHGGLERGAMDISERTLREVFLPPWEAGIKKAGALGVMATYPTIDGVPVHSSKKMLTDILRGELQFDGLVLSEGNGVNTLVYTGVAHNIREAAAMAANAGMDVSISFDQGYFDEMIQNVEKGVVSMDVIDRSVRRILEQKFRLGLFDNPFTDAAEAAETVHNRNHQELAFRAACESIVLLRNEPAGKNKKKILPLPDNIKSIAVIGPNANHDRNQLGDYTSDVILQDVTTVLEGIRERAGENINVSYVQGCNVTGEKLNEIDKAVEAARQSDVAVVVVGENEWQAEGKQGTVGEGYDVATLELTGLQNQLIQKVAETGTPVVVVLINGRALAIPWIAENIPAIVEAWNPGEKGGDAVAAVLFGDINPAGKLPVTFPRHAGQLPIYYNHKPSKTEWLERGWGHSYADLKQQGPLFEFGYGLSYTEFEYDSLVIHSPVIGPNGSTKISCTITNAGDRPGSEIVQLYIRDKISSVVRPVKELKGFRKLHLQPGESQTALFQIGHEELQMYDVNMNRIVEPGEFEIMVGASSADIRLAGVLIVHN